MTNKEFTERLIKRIEDHKHKLCDGQTGYLNAAYALAHEHIIELISVEATLLEAEEAAMRSHQ